MKQWIALWLVAGWLCPAQAEAKPHPDRAYSVEVLTRVARPVLTALAEGRLKQELPVHEWERNRTNYSGLEALGRTLAGIAPWLVIAGVWLQITGLAIVGLIGFGAAVLFTFATLPVEIGASGKALAFVNNLGMSGARHAGARDVLKAAAWTYVAGALTALLTFLYYAWLVFGRRD